ncbi:MAG: TRAP transporter small permease subunit [Syntrophaceae bacterium]|nr:TRAP transporter small permease subunit [Syntrophaceae bacterium]
MEKLDKVLEAIDSISEWVGKTFSYALLIIMCIVLYDVIMRRLFARPTSWVFEISFMLWGAYFLMVAGWTELNRGHLSIDVFYSQFPEKVKIYIDLIFYLIFWLLWTGVLVKGGFDFALKSWGMLEHSQTSFSPPLYPMKSFIPLGFAILWLQCAAKFIRDLRKLIKGEY